jgi:hypothetical protein
MVLNMRGGRNLRKPMNLGLQALVINFAQSTANPASVKKFPMFRGDHV